MHRGPSPRHRHRPENVITTSDGGAGTANYIHPSSFHLIVVVSLQVEIMPPHGEISVGESKFFLCEVVGDAKDIDWFAPSGEKLLPNRQDISVSRNDDSSSTLTIYSATVDNAGIYKCVAKNGDKEAEATVNVKIYQKLTFQNAPSPQEFNEGDDAVIVCDVISSPPPTIIWKYQRTKIQPEKDVRFKILSNNHLQIRSIKKSDEGDYTCEGRIMARGEIDLRVIKVIINVLPSIRTRHTELNATADIEQAVTLACYADGYPEPTVTWMRISDYFGKASEELSEAEKIASSLATLNLIYSPPSLTVLSFGHHLGRPLLFRAELVANEKYSLNDDGSELTIKDVKKLDEGDYTCTARNKAGEKQEEISLKVFVQPKITYLKNQTASELEEQTVLTCEATGDPTPSIVWSFGRRTFSEGEQVLFWGGKGDFVVRVLSNARVSSLTLKYVQYTDAGQYLCSAHNSIGQDIQSMYLEVRYAPKITEDSKLAKFTWEGNAANLTCEALAHPSASVQWFRDGMQLPAVNTTNIKIYNTPTTSYLEVTPESQSDFGSYNCTATNVIGSDSKEFMLISADVPLAPAIDRVEPYPSTALVEFDEPESDGGVPVLKYKAQWRTKGQDWISKVYKVEEGLSSITIVGLKPETEYEVMMSAINGKGEGESCPPETFKTLPVREPNPPKLEAKVQPPGNEMKVNWIKQDDGGSPIKQYLLSYRPVGLQTVIWISVPMFKQKHHSNWKTVVRVPNGGEFYVLRGLEWNTEYEVSVVAENQQGRSEPGILFFKTSSEPTAIPDTVTGGSGLGTGAIVGILVVVFLLLLVAVDVTCYFLNKCGLLMCIAVNFCGKSGPTAKAKDIEEGKAAFTKDDSKEPIVEVRTEEERTPNHEGGIPCEPNETTPLTDPEHAADTTATVVDLLPSLTTNSESVTDSPASESTTLNSSTAPAPDPKTTASPQSCVNKPSITSPTTPDTPLVDLSDGPPIQATQPSDTSKSFASSSTPKNATDAIEKTDSTTVSQVDGGIHQASDGDLVHDSDANSAPAVPSQDDGKIVEDGKSKAPETDAMKPSAEVKTVPNEAPQTNGNESKA
ncbi:Neural cell adhesion molecule 1 [Bagarius yarrelli]|uniref:Neural cell adhesion molecule 1 n=1 Tax=Bagarius yarrelli TaxID=175774 RepID=A0A556UZE1_BAGYA|nr:Neural cell adhesion molecule 1 [Bagarius yarrelli]